jgi:hypothetical protein
LAESTALSKYRCSLEAVLCYRTLVKRLLLAARLPLLLFAVVTGLLFVDVCLSTALLPINPRAEHSAWYAFPDSLWLDGWTRFDGGWYWQIAKRGYYYDGPNKQSAVAFFPAYPLAMRALTPIFTHPLIAAIAITVLCGGLVAILFYRWVSMRTDRKTALASLLALLLYPFAYYLTGAAYADAMFLAAALGAFLAVESDKPLLAGVLGALATATRPVGLAIVVGLFVLTLERRVTPRGPATWATLRAMLRAPKLLQARHYLVLLSPLGLVLFAIYLWYRFGDPYTFVAAEGAPGWGHEPGIRTWLKFEIWKIFSRPGWAHDQILVAGHVVLTLAGFALTPLVFRNFGWGYGVYVLCVLAIPSISSKDLVGMGRYMLAAFPLFGVLGTLLASRPRLRRTYLVSSAALLVILTSLFSRWYYVS